MEKLTIQTLLLNFFIVFLLLSVSCPETTSDEVEDETEFKYDEDSDKGPNHWGEIRPEWSICGDGKMQSPIDMLNERVEEVFYMGNHRRNYKPSNATLINRGHDIMLKWEDGAGHIDINGNRYELQQCHWHSPSEHTMNGRRFDLEVHLVHKSKSNKSAVIGMWYKIGQPDPLLSEMKEHLTAMANAGEKKRLVGMVDPKQIKISSKKYYSYIGSLTVPPCTQNVIWTILTKVGTVSKEQVKLLSDAVHDGYETNARPVQPINKRSVHLYRPRDGED